MSLAVNNEPSFKPDHLPLIIAAVLDLGDEAWASIVAHYIVIGKASLGAFFYEVLKTRLEGPMAYLMLPFATLVSAAGF